MMECDLSVFILRKSLQVGDAGLRVTWTCDPMKENTLTTANGCLSCPVDLVLAEVRACCDLFFLCYKTGKKR